MTKKHCANCAHWGVKGSEESMCAYINTHTQRWGHAPEEDERWRWCAQVWEGRADIVAKNGSAMAISSADFTCEKFAAKRAEQLPTLEAA